MNDIKTSSDRGYKTLDQVRVEGKRVFVRVDFNVPLDEDGNISDDTRIRAALPTIKALQARGAKIILASHLGRPKGKRNSELSLEPVGAYLAELLGEEILFPDDCIGGAQKKLNQNLRDGQIMLLENLRFHQEEVQGEEGFSRELAQNIDVYVNDAFGAAHRAHASVVGVPQFVGDRAAGLLMQKELEFLGGLVQGAQRPFIAIVGGAKVSDKIGVIENLLQRVDTIIIGGAMAYTFLLAQGMDVGDSLVEEDKVKLAMKLLVRAEERNVKFMLPMDHVVVEEISKDASTRVVSNGEFPEGWKGVDIGPRSRERFGNVISTAKTIFWNGPMGIFEISSFAEGTDSIANAVAQSQGTSVVGGGDSVSAIRKAGVSPFISHISTGGGASLEYIEGKELPGLGALGA